MKKVNNIFTYNDSVKNESYNFEKVPFEMSVNGDCHFFDWPVGVTWLLLVATELGEIVLWFPSLMVLQRADPCDTICK